MNIIDIIILVCFVPAVFNGLSKGFVDQAFSLIALVLGVWLSFKFSGMAGDWLASFVDLPGTVLHIISFILILILVSLVMWLIGKLVEKVLKFVMLGWLNKLLGVVFALIKCFLIIGLVIILFESVNSLFSFVPAQTLDNSMLYHPIKDLADIVFPFLKELIFKK